MSRGSDYRYGPKNILLRPEQKFNFKQKTSGSHYRFVVCPIQLTITCMVPCEYETVQET